MVEEDEDEGEAAEEVEAQIALRRGREIRRIDREEPLERPRPPHATRSIRLARRHAGPQRGGGSHAPTSRDSASESLSRAAAASWERSRCSSTTSSGALATKSRLASLRSIFSTSPASFAISFSSR